MKRWLTLLLALLCLACGCAQAELVTDDDDGATPTDLSTATDLACAGASSLEAASEALRAALVEAERMTCVIDLTQTPDAVWTFAADRPVLEIVFPQIAEADACIMRLDGHVLLLDAGGTVDIDAVLQAFEWMGVDHIEVGLCTHPHHDHMPGFALIAEQMQLDQVLIPFGPGVSRVMDQELPKLDALGVPVVQCADGDVLTFAGAGEELHLVQRSFTEASVNNRSLIVYLTYGRRTALFTADIEKETQRLLMREPPACGLLADVLKYPHHGIARMQGGLMDLVRPQLAIVTNDAARAHYGVDRLTEYGVPTKFTVDGVLRLRTDGVIWVVDWLTGPEE